MGDLSDETVYEIKYTLQTKTGLADGTTITNTAVIKSDNETELDANNRNANTVTIVSDKSDISVLKTINKTEVKSGDVVEYTITYKNTGKLKAENIVITDIFNNEEFDSTTFTLISPITENCTVQTNATTSKKYIECSIAEITDEEDHEIKYTLQTKSGLANGLVVKNTVVIASNNETEITDKANNTAESIVTINNIVATATPVPTAIPTVVPTSAPIPTTTPNTHNSSSSSSGGSGGGCNTESTIDLSINGFIKAKGANDSEYSDATKKVVATIAKNMNSEATYKVIILNKGTSYAYNTEVEMKFISENIKQSDITNITGAELEKGIFIINDAVPSNGNVSFTFDVKLKSEEGTAQSTFTIKSFAIDYKCPKIKTSEGIGKFDTVYMNAGNVIDTSPVVPIINTPITSASTAEAYRLIKTADKSEVKAGEIITYTLSLKNIGTQDLKNVMLFDMFPKEYLEPVNGSEKRLVDPTTLKFKRKFLPVGDTFTKIVTMKVKSHILAGTEITNILKAGSQTIEMKKSAETTTTVVSNQQGNLQELYTPQSNASAVSRPRQLIQTGADAPIIPFGFALLFAGIYIYRRKQLI